MMKSVNNNQYFKKAYEFLKEAEKKLPVKNVPESMQVCEKLWAAWAQAIKGYKYWRTECGYLAVMGELYNKYPHLKEEIKTVHILARFLHSDGFYEGVYQPEIKDVENIKKGVELIERLSKE